MVEIGAQHRNQQQQQQHIFTHSVRDIDRQLHGKDVVVVVVVMTCNIECFVLNNIPLNVSHLC